MTINNIKQITFNNTSHKIFNEYLTSEWVYGDDLPSWTFNSSGSTTEYTIDLSDFLPNDNNEYMLLLHGKVWVTQDNNSNEILVSPATDSTYDMEIRLANCITRVASGQSDSSMAFIKVGISRKIVIRCGGTATLGNGSAYIKVLAYRRLGKPPSELTPSIGYLDTIQRNGYQYDLGDTSREVRCLKESDNPILNSTIDAGDNVTLDLSVFLPDTSCSYLCQFSIRETHKTAIVTDDSGVINYACTSALKSTQIISRYEQANSSSTDRAEGLFYVILTNSKRAITIANQSDRTNNSVILHLVWIRKIPDVPIAYTGNELTALTIFNTNYLMCPKQHLDEPWNWLSTGYICFDGAISSGNSVDIDLTTWIANNCYSSPEQGAISVATENRLIEILFTVTSNTASALDSEQTCNIVGKSLNANEVVLQAVDFCYLKSQKSSGNSQCCGRSPSMYFVRRPLSDNKFILVLNNWAEHESGTINVYIAAWRWINVNNTFSIF